MTESIEINESNWMQFWNTEVEVCFDPNDNDWLPRILAGFEPTRAYRFIAGDSNWKHARTITTKPEPAEKVFLVSDDHREIFEALRGGALIDNEIRNYWDAGFDVKCYKILLTPDYTKPLADQEWVRMELRK